MKVTIVGGWSDVPQDNEDWQLDVSDREAFIAACEAIGRRLAKNQHAIVVGNDKDNSADRHVVRGFLSEFERQEAPKPLVYLIEGIQGSGHLYPEERKSDKYRKLFLGSSSPFSGQRPRAADKILSTREADALVAIGGLNDTYVAGVAAILANKPVLPFASFGGASLQLWRALHMLSRRELTDDFSKLSDQTWDEELIDAAFRFGGLDRPGIFLGSSGKADRIASAIKSVLDDMGFRVTYWKTDFESGQVILDQLRQASFSCKYAILLLTPDESFAGNVSRRVPSGNVLFELGYFINALGKERTRAIVQQGTEVLADYGGHIFIPLPTEADVSAIEPELQKFLSSDLPQQNAVTGRATP